MIIVKIILGLIGLGIVVFVHELGHFIAARLAGIDVEAFAIGWGKPLLAKKIRGVEYRLSIFPIGGYCKMRGEDEYAKAKEQGLDHIARTPGTFYGATPFRRILVAFAGPFFNILFAALVFSLIWGAGFEFTTMGNRIVLASDVSPGTVYPAEAAGLRTGDQIIEINGKKIENWHDIQSRIAINAEENLRLQVLRDGKILDMNITPQLDKSSGAGKIGVYFWADPVVGSVLPDSPAALAGLQSGDRIVAVNGQDVPYTAAIYRILDGAERPGLLDMELERGGERAEARLELPSEGEPLGIAWQALTVHTPRYSFFEGIGRGFSETWDTVVVSVRSLALLFRGIDLTKAVSGPVRITVMAGEIATDGFGQGVGTGFRAIGNFLALISISLAIMNLLPLPVLDGGLIVLFIIEILRRGPLSPRFISAFQTVGVVLIGALMFFALFGDIVFLVKG